MPAFVGVVKVNSVGTSGVLHIGDVYIVAPYSLTKTFSGAGSFNTGVGITNNNAYSITTTYDKDAIDSSIIANN
ncbi:spore germination protein [Pseudalkalibacillus caeni]|uniref:Spore germination protein n=1 Tax=Exobacillus caeni TaxID=2574798 RepID=A0A5R9F6A9_9BACL|nr:spore germination protein [Pseudalkalibacillus caeni]TLS37920.1 spore germination protein [Pseudalkalibacillus caeni]